MSVLLSVSKIRVGFQKRECEEQEAQDRGKLVVSSHNRNDSRRDGIATIVLVSKGCVGKSDAEIAQSKKCERKRTRLDARLLSVVVCSPGCALVYNQAFHRFEKL